jgi:ATP-binding cassette subfamily C protein
MRLLISLARKYPWQSVIMLLALLLAGIAEGIGLSAMLPLISTVVGNQAGPVPGAAASGSGLEKTVTETLSVFGLTPTLGTLLVVFVLTILLKNGLVLVARKRVGYTVAHVVTDLRLALLRALLVARWEYFLRQPTGAIINAMLTETARTSKAYQRGATIVALVIQMLVYVGVALLVSWQATLISLAVGLILAFSLKRFINKARRAGTRQTKLLVSLNRHLIDTLQSIKPLKAMARENQADSLLEKKTTNLNKALQKQVLSRQLLKAVQEPLLTIFMAIGLYIILVYWRLPLATTMVLAFLLARIVKQVNNVQQQYQEMAVLESAYWSLQETIQKTEQAHETTLGSQVPSLKHGIRLDRVSFAYQEDWVLRNASLTFPSGLFTAIVGPSGAGKTTIVDLVTALLRPQQGEIWVDDLPLEEVDIRRWRGMIGYVPQETVLLHDTVLFNVTLGDPELNEEDAEYALRAAGAWEFVTAMPRGVYSTVGERGAGLSGGERQRIAIARALVRKPKLLILDEPTSAMDRNTEAAICETLQQLSGDYTILAISHQPALTKAADRAYHLQDGEAALVEDRSTASKHLDDIEDDSGLSGQAAIVPGTGG